MIGGPDEAVERLDPIFATIAPGVDSAERTPGPRAATPSTAENGYLHCGPSGAGHFVKMVHNGIEYGVMAAYAEGLNILKNADAGMHAARGRRRDRAAHRPRVLPVRARHPRGRRGLAPRQRDRLLAARPDRGGAAASRPTLEDFEGRVSDSGEGRWTSIAAIEEGVPAPVLSSALYSRFASRDLDDFADKVLSAMRKQFGGHDEKK